ncbi:calpastatin isoform X2 [Heptranchias perlo]|uniref:calpastatin isoform X2 n=1 Tax=Heptranchias perlo TaxID=212740 RepID=UPI00355A981C
MSQSNKKKTKAPRKGDKKAASSKQGGGTSAQASEEKKKDSPLPKAEGSKPISSTNKPSEKLGSETSHKSADASKGKPTVKMDAAGGKITQPAKAKTAPDLSAKPSGAAGEKQLQSPTVATQQSKTAPKKPTTAQMDTKEVHAETLESKLPGTSVHKNTDPKIQGKDPFDLLAETLPSEAPDNSAPKYTGPAVKESDASKKKAERVGETEESIPPDYRFTEQPDPKDKGKMASSSTGPGTKPKVTEKSMTEDDVLTSLSADFVHSSPAPISKSSATTSHSAALPSVQKQAPVKASTAASVSASQSVVQGKDPFDLLAETLPSEAPDNSAPKYTGPAVKESDASKKKAERVGETEESIPPAYRFTEQPDPKDKGKIASSSTGPGTKPKVTEKGMTEDDVLTSLSADFVHSSPAPISKSSATTSHSAALPSVQKQAPVKATTAASVSASQSVVQGKDPFDLLAETLPTEAPDNSAPKYTGPAVKESDASKKKAERVGETEESIPPDYRFTEQPDPKDKGKMASSSTGPGTKPKSMTEDDVLTSLSADFVHSSPAPISKSSATTSHSAALPSVQKQAPVKATTAASVSASQSVATGKDPFDLLAETLPTEAPDNSAPKYTGPAVKESDASKKKAERVGETEESIPPDYRFTEQPDSKDKGKMASSSTGPGTKPKVTEKSMTEDDVLTSLSADFVHSSPAPISKSSATTSHSAALPSVQKQAPVKASTAASVSASQSVAQGKDLFDLLAETLPTEAPDNSAPQYTGPAVKESDASKKKAERVGETEESIPPAYRFTEQPDPKDKGKMASSSTGPGTKPKVTEKSMTEDDVLTSLSADFVHSSPAPISKSSATTSHSAALPSVQKQSMTEDDVLTSLSADFVHSSPAPISKSSATTSHSAALPSVQKQAPVKASTAASVSASQSVAQGKDPFDLLAETLPSEAPDNSAPKYTGPAVKESDASKKKAERVGETEESIPPDYRFTEQPDPKDKGKTASSSTGPGTKPKSMTEGDIVDSLSADFVPSSLPPISSCSAAVSHSAALPSLQKQAPVKASTAASVSASQSVAQGKDPFDLLAETLPSEAPDSSAPKYTGPAVKESDVSKKKAERVGETEESIPPDYRFTEQPDPKDKVKTAASSTGPGTKPKLTEKSMTEGDILDSLSADFSHSSQAPISSCSAPVSHSAAPPSMQTQAPLKASTAASVSASQSGAMGKDAFDLLAETLPSEAPDNSTPKYTGPAVKESDASKKKAQLVGETEESIPPDYRFTEQPDPKDKGKTASSSTGPGTKPKVTGKSLTQTELADMLSSDFDSCTAASHSVAEISKQKRADHKTGDVSKAASSVTPPKTSDVGPKSPKKKDQSTAKSDAKKGRKH